MHIYCRHFFFLQWFDIWLTVLQLIMQCDLLTVETTKLLVFALSFNAPKKHVLNYFVLEMAEIVIAKRRHRREHRARGRRERIFFINLFRKRKNASKHIIFQAMLFVNLHWEIKENLVPLTRRSDAITGLSKLLATLHFLASGSFQSISWPAAISPCRPRLVAHWS